MSYFSKTQKQFDTLLKGAKSRVCIFCGEFDSSFWHEKANGSLLKKSLIDRLKTFLNKRDVFLDIIYRDEQSLDDLSNGLEKSDKTTIIPLTDKEFVKPTYGLCESFIVVDRSKSFVSPNYESDTGVFCENSFRATFLLSVFSQLMRHEFQKKQNRMPLHTHLPLAEIPQAAENINALIYHHNSPIQTLRRHNPFIEKIVNIHQK